MFFSQQQTSENATNLAEKSAKFWMSVAGVVIVINLFLILTLMQMAPKLKVIAQISAVSPMQSNQLLQTEPFSRRMEDKNLIDETLLRYYMEMRHTTFQDKDEMQLRWGNVGPVARLSSPEVYEKFARKLADKITAATGGHKTTSIDIVSISRLDNIFTVEFDLYSYEQNKVTHRRRVAVVTIGYSQSKVFYNTAYSNPFGFYVRSYDETKKG